MKKFTEYLMESHKAYALRIKFAFKPSAEVIKKVQEVLAKWEGKKDGELKSHPVQRVDAGFPSIENPEVYSLDVICNYPVSAEQLRKAVCDIPEINAQEISVAGTNFDDMAIAEAEAVKANTKKDGALLTSVYDDIKIAHPYGDDYNAKLVKNSVTGTGQVKVKGGSKPAETTNDLKQGNKSPVGSNKNKLPKVKSSVR